MKVKMSDVQLGAQGLNQLATVALPAAASFKVALLLKELRTPLETFDEKRKKLLQEVGKPVEGSEGEKWTIEDKERWEKEMKEMGDTEVEINTPKLKMSECGSASIEPRTLFALEWWVEQ